MFGFWKKDNQIQQRLNGIEKRILSAENGRKADTENISARLSELSSAANRHDMAITDMLDTWEEWQESWREENAKLRAALSERADAMESIRRENTLLEITMACYDQLYALHRAAAEDRAWERQFKLAEEKLSGKLLLADLQIVEDKDAPVDYDLHEVIGVVETADPKQAMRVADVYACGYAYRGKMVRKAKVTAFQQTSRTAAEYEQTEENNERDHWH